MKSSRIIVSLALLCGLGVCGFFAVLQKHPAYADSAGGASPTTSTAAITHDPIPAQAQGTFPTLGFEISNATTTGSSSSSPLLTQDQGLKATDTLMQQFGGTSRNIQLVNLSRVRGNGYAHLTPDQAANDPHIVNGELKDVPCYFITINGVNIQASSSPLATKQAPPLPATQLNVVVDATNGKILCIYCVHQDVTANQ